MRAMLWSILFLVRSFFKFNFIVLWLFLCFGGGGVGEEGAGFALAAFQFVARFYQVAVAHGLDAHLHLHTSVVGAVAEQGEASPRLAVEFRPFGRFRQGVEGELWRLCRCRCWRLSRRCGAPLPFPLSSATAGGATARGLRRGVCRGLRPPTRGGRASGLPPRCRRGTARPR